VPGVLDQSPASLHQRLLQAREGPVLDPLRECQPTPKVHQVVGQHAGATAGLRARERGRHQFYHFRNWRSLLSSNARTVPDRRRGAMKQDGGLRAAIYCASLRQLLSSTCCARHCLLWRTERSRAMVDCCPAAWERPMIVAAVPGASLSARHGQTDSQ
jgi:hypothetical protein